MDAINLTNATIISSGTHFLPKNASADQIKNSDRYQLSITVGNEELCRKITGNSKELFDLIVELATEKTSYGHWLDETNVPKAK